MSKDKELETKLKIKVKDFVVLFNEIVGFQFKSVKDMLTAKKFLERNDINKLGLTIEIDQNSNQSIIKYTKGSIEDYIDISVLDKDLEVFKIIFDELESKCKINLMYGGLLESLGLYDE